MEQKTTPFNVRSFTACSMLSAGILLPVSGLFNHFFQFDAMTIERHAWMTVHNVSAILFCIFTIWHISLNWRPMLKHIRHAAEQFMGIRKEAVVGALLVFGIVAVMTMHAFHVR